MAMEQENNGNRPQEHPLLNSVVLKQVFEYLKPIACLDTLKSVRQVCTTWRDESLGWWKETAIFRLTWPMIEDFYDPEITTMIQLLKEKPFHKYKLQSMLLSISDCYNKGSKENRFWTTVGPLVKHLIVAGVEFEVAPGTEGFLGPVHKPIHAFMQFLIDYLPNLTTLDVEGSCLGLGEFLEDMPIHYDKSMELQHPTLVSIKFDRLIAVYFALRNFPNLQHLAFWSFYAFHVMLQNEDISEDSPVVLPSLKDLELILEENTSFNDEDLNLDFGWQLEVPALERLSVDFLHGRHNSCFKFLRMMLLENFEKLKVLEVSCRPYVHPYSNFPFECQMDHLTELRLWGNVVKDLSFLKWTPKLKVLHMDPYGLEKKDVPEPRKRGNMHKPTFDIVEATLREGGMEGVVLHDLEYLQFMHNYNYCNYYPLESFKTLGEWMPNLKTLRTVLSKGSVAVICELWPLLEKLVGLYGPVPTDEDIIGNEAQEKKGLVDFAELKSFHLNAACDAGRLTDLAVHSGFLKMSKLTDLQICVSDKFTMEAEKLLKDGIFNVGVIRNYAGNEEHVNWECCKNKDWMKFLQGGRICTTESDSTTDSEDEYYDEETQSESEEDEQEETTENNDEEEAEKSQEESGDDTEDEKKGSNGEVDYLENGC